MEHSTAMPTPTHSTEPATPPQARAPLTGALDGHLTRVQLESVLDKIADDLAAQGPAPVLLDCSRMEGYDLDARHAFVDWNKRSRDQVPRVAIVTANRLYHVVIATMSLAAGQQMKGFAEHTEAVAWLES